MKNDDKSGKDKLKSAAKKLASGAKKAGKKYVEYTEDREERVQETSRNVEPRDALGFGGSSKDKSPGFGGGWGLEEDEGMTGFSGDDSGWGMDDEEMVGFGGGDWDADDDEGWGLVGEDDEDDDDDADWLGGW